MNGKHLTLFPRQTKGFLLLFGLLLCWFWLAVEGCSPVDGNAPPPTVKDTVGHADAVIYGKVLAHYPEQFTQAGFTAEMEIFCVFKGGQIPQIVNITRAGYQGGMCFATTLLVNKSYIVYLWNDGIDLSPSDTDVEITGLSDPFLENITRLCDLNTTYPAGVNHQSAYVQCPKAAQGPDCVGISTDQTSTTDGPPLKEFTTPEVKTKGTKNSASGTDNLGQPENEASSIENRSFAVTTAICAAVIMSCL